MGDEWTVGTVLQMETTRDRSGQPRFTIVVFETPDVWRQTSDHPGRPGFVCWRMHEVEGVQGDGTLLYWRSGSRSNGDPVDKIADADAVANGTVKWDGCANFETEGMMHVCDALGAAMFSRALVRAYDLALVEVGGGL